MSGSSISSSSVSSSSSSSSNSSSSSSSNLFNGAVSFYHGIGGPNNYALSDSNIYISTNLSQWVKLQGQLPSNTISDIKLFNYKLYLCTDTGFYQINGSNGFDFTKIIIDLNNPNLAVNSVGSSFYFNDDGDQIVIRYYPMRAFARRKKAVQIPKIGLAGFEIKKSLFGIRKSLVLHQKTKKGAAKYPAISITSLNRKESELMVTQLKRYVRP
jgi:hypothetical protein